MDSDDKDIFRFLDLPVELQGNVLGFLVPERLEVVPVETVESSRHGPSTPTDYVLTFSSVDTTTYQTICSLRAVSHYIRQQWCMLLQRATPVLRVNMISCPPTTLDDRYDAGFIPKAMMSVLHMFRTLSDPEIINRHYVEVGSAGEALVRQYQLQSSIKLGIAGSGASRFAVQATVIAQSMAAFRTMTADLEERRFVKTQMRRRLFDMVKVIFNSPCNVQTPDHVWELCSRFVKIRPSIRGGRPTRSGNTSRSKLICPVRRSQEIMDAKAIFAVPDDISIAGFTDAWVVWYPGNKEVQLIGDEEEKHIRTPILCRNSLSYAVHWSTNEHESNAEFAHALNDNAQFENHVRGCFRQHDQKLLFEAGGHEFYVRGKERRLASRDDVSNAEAVAVLRKEFMESRFATSEIDNDGMDWISERGGWQDELICLGV